MSENLPNATPEELGLSPVAQFDSTDMFRPGDHVLFCQGSNEIAYVQLDPVAGNYTYDLETS